MQSTRSDSRGPFGFGHQGSPDTRARIGAKDTRRPHERKCEETCLRSSPVTLCAPHLNPNTSPPDTAESTNVEDVANEDQCVLAVLSSDCTMLKIQ